MFRLVQDLPGLTVSSLTEGLRKLRYVKAAEDAEHAAGFVAPVDSEEDVLAYEVDGAFLIAFKEESKILPGSVIRERVDELIADIEAQQNRRVGKKETKELRERAVSELLKKAFSRCKTTYAFIDTKSSVLWIDASSRAKAGDLVECLRRTVEGFACSPLKVNGSASAIMTAWLQSGEAPEGWSIEEDATLIENENTGGKISIKRQSLLKDEVVNHLNNGMQVESMTLTWNDKIFLRLSDELLVKGILPLDLIKTKMMESESETQLERLQADLTIMMGEFRLMLEDITLMFGGETGRQYDLVTKAEVDADDLYPAAVQLVQAEQRASISYVQRNLRIGYNRAARLIEKMEAEGIVSTMHADGSRQVLQVAH